MEVNFDSETGEKLSKDAKAVTAEKAMAHFAEVRAGFQVEQE